MNLPIPLLEPYWSGSLNSKPLVPEQHSSHWHRLAILLERAPNHASHLLSVIPSAPPDPEALPSLVHLAIESELTDLLGKHLLAGLLLAPVDLRGLWPEETILSLLNSLPAFPNPALLLKEKWIGIPLLTMQGGQPYCIHMLLSDRRLSDRTCLLPPFINQTTEQVIVNSIRSGWPDREECGYWFLQANNDPPVRGDSLALPVALAAMLLQEKKRWPRGLFATGGLRADATVAEVDEVRKKQQLARTLGCLLFLHPPHQQNTMDNSLACATFQQARESLIFFLQGADPDAIALYQACRHSMDNLLIHFHQLPPNLLREKWCEKMLARAAAKPDHYLNPLAECFNRCRNSPAHTAILARLFKPEGLIPLLSGQGNNHKTVQAACSWIETMLAQATRKGDNTTARSWRRVGEKLLPHAEMDEEIRLLLREIVAKRFNHYDFRHALPQRFTRLLAKADKVHCITGQSSYQLGAMYGTVAQNYGFCGPAWIDRLKEAASQAEQAFGKRHENEKNRLLNYRIYGLLDNNQLDRAVLLLTSYLEVDHGTDTKTIFQQGLRLLTGPNQDNPFQAALAFRYLASTGSCLRDGLPANAQALAMQGQGHPWQHICVNLARLALKAGQADRAEQLLCQATTICMNGGETMRAMALLPLALLHRHQLAGSESYGQAMTLCRWILEESGLNRKHFSCLTGHDRAETLLATVWINRKHIYPFSYR